MAEQGTKPPRLLYADLFKFKPGVDSSDNKPKSSCSDSSWSSSQVSSAWDSSSSSGSSDLCGDDGDFIAELTRQMAECMLRDDDGENSKTDSVSEESQGCSADSTAEKNQNHVYGGGDASSECSSVSEPGQTTSFQGYEPRNHQSPNPVIRKSPNPRIGRRSSFAGYGMHAVFLKSPSIGVPGTGVFLPRVDTVPFQFKKKTGCSTVLIPTRVLEVLELHHNRKFPSCPSYPGHVSPIPLRPKGENDEEEEEMLLQLPQEWTY